MAGVWPGVGEQESHEKVGEGGFVEKGEPGLERLVLLCAIYTSSSSCECERDIECDE